MSHTYANCRGCDATRYTTHLSARGWCPACAFNRASEANAASIATAVNAAAGVTPTPPAPPRRRRKSPPRGI